MTRYLHDAPADDIPEGDAAEQRAPADVSEDVDLDPRDIADLSQREANPLDVIDQAIAVPMPEDDQMTES